MRRALTRPPPRTLTAAARQRGADVRREGLNTPQRTVVVRDPTGGERSGAKYRRASAGGTRPPLCVWEGG
eukprot:gene22721-36525_t